MAGRIPESFIDEARQAVNIVDVIGQYVALTKKGKDYVGLCPFHQEKTPSFTVNEPKQFFKCFGCGKGGNVFKFLMYQENLTFPESVEKVATLAHLTLPDAFTRIETPMDPLRKMYQKATAFYHHILLTTKMGERALSYAKKRELDANLLDHFKIGYAPEQEDILLTYLRQQDYSEAELVKSGLFIQSSEGKLYDRFRDRLMFPLDDESGATVAFSGRRLSDQKEIAKYVNSPETPVFSKSKLLFHFSEAKKAVRQEKHLILYEGYMDVIAAYRSGILSGVASMGTSLTDDQVYILKRTTPNVIVNYDGDPPGVHAAERAARLFDTAGGFNLGIVILPENLDPDEFVKKYGVEKYRQEVKGAMTTTDFLLQQTRQNYNLHNDREKLAYVTQALQLIAPLADPVARDLYLTKLAKETGTTLNALQASLLREKQKQRRVDRRKKAFLNQPAPIVSEPQSAPTAEQDHEDPVLQRLLYLFIHSDEARDYLLDHQFLFPQKSYAELAELWLQFAAQHPHPDPNSFLDFIPEALQGIIVSIEMSRMPTDFSERELEDQLHALQKRRIDHQLGELMQQLSEAQSKEDKESELKITQKIIALKRQK